MLFVCVFARGAKRVPLWARSTKSELYSASDALVSDLAARCLFFPPLLRCAQEAALKLPHTAMVTAVDLGDPTSPHRRVVGRPCGPPPPRFL